MRSTVAAQFGPTAAYLKLIDEVVPAACSHQYSFAGLKSKRLSNDFRWSVKGENIDFSYS